MEFPSNSSQARTPEDYADEPKQTQSRARGVKVERRSEKEKIEPVVLTGEVVRRKKPLRKRFTEMFVGGDARTAGSYVVMDVLVPAAKDMIADAFSQGIEKMLFGEARSRSRRGGSPLGGGTGYTNYGRFSTAGTNRYGRDEPRVPSRRARANHDFDEIILATRLEAEEVIDRMFDYLQRYESVSVSDLYELVGVSGDFTDEKYGWTDLRGAGVTRIHNGYLLDLPKPDLLD